MNEPYSKPRSRRWIIVVVVAGIVILAVPFVLMEVRGTIKRRLEQQIAEKVEAVRKRGDPVTAEDFAKRLPKVPDAQNAALLYLRAQSNFVANESLDDDDTNTPLGWLESGAPPWTPMPPETKAALRAWIASNTVALGLIHEGAQLKDAAYPLNFAHGFLHTERQILDKTEMIHLVGWQADLAAEDGRTDTAMQSISDLFALAESYRQHPFPIARMLRASYLRVAANSLEAVMSRVALTDAQLLYCQKAFRAAEGVDWVGPAIYSERGLALEAEKMFPRPTIATFLVPPKKERGYALWYWLLGPQRSMLAYLEVMDKYEATLRLPMKDRIKAEIEIGNEMERNRSIFFVGEMPPPHYEWFSSDYVKGEAQLVTAEAAMGVQRYRLAHQGQLPDSLKALVPPYFASEPVSPYDGKALTIQKREHGFTVSTEILKVGYNVKEMETVTFTVEDAGAGGAK